MSCIFNEIQRKVIQTSCMLFIARLLFSAVNCKSLHFSVSYDIQLFERQICICNKWTKCRIVLWVGLCVPQIGMQLATHALAVHHFTLRHTIPPPSLSLCHSLTHSLCRGPAPSCIKRSRKDYTRRAQAKKSSLWWLFQYLL